MPTPIRLWCATLLALLLLVADASAGELGPVVVPDGKARTRAHRADAQALFRSRFPTKDDLGPGWFLPWEAPKGVTAHMATEASYWRHMKVNEAWAQFFGLTEAQIVKIARASIDKGFARMGGGDNTRGVPAALRSFVSKPGVLSMALGLIRRQTVLAEKPRPQLAIEVQALAAKIQASVLLKPEKRAEHQARLQVESLVAIGADLRGLDYDAALKALAHEIRSVRRVAKMTYVAGDAEAWKKTTTSRAVPDHGAFTVEMYLLADEDTKGATGDLLPSAVDATRKRLSAAVRGMLDAQRELAIAHARAQIEKLEKQIRSYTTMGRNAGYLQKRMDELEASVAASREIPAPQVQIQNVDAGENAWFASIHAKTHDGRTYGQYFGRLRNGNAVVNVTGTGTHAPARMREDLIYMLGAMDARTKVFGDE